MPDLSKLVLEIDSKGVVTASGNLDVFTKKAKEVGAESEKAGKKATGFGADLKNGLIGSVAAGTLAAEAIKKVAQAGVNLVQSSLAASGQLEMIRANLETVMGSAELAGKTFQDLKDFANRTPFNMPGITDSAIMLKQSGVAAGDLISTLQNLGDAAGGSQEKLDRIALNYAQIMSVGKASTMDIKQFAMAGLPIYDALAKVLGVSNEELGDMVGNGKVTKEVVVKAFQDMTGAGGAFYNGMARGAVTLEGKMSTLQDTWKSYIALVADANGISDLAKNSADVLTVALQGQSNELEYQLALKQAIAAQDAGETLSIDQQIVLLKAKIGQVHIIRGLLFNRAELIGEVAHFVTTSQKEVTALNSQIDALKVKAEWEERIAKFRSDAAEAEKKQKADALKDQKEKDQASKSKWQEPLKSALGVENVSSGSAAFEEYQSKTESSLNGALAFAKMTGGSIRDVYTEYASDISKALETLMKSGLWKSDEKTIVEMDNYRKKIQSMADAKTGMTGYQYGSPENPNFMPDTKNPFALAPVENQTGFSMNYGDLQSGEETDLDKKNTQIMSLTDSLSGLEDKLKSLGPQFAQLAANATFDGLRDVGAALYDGANAAEAFGRSMLKSIINNVPAMLFQAGFELAISGNIYGGLALMAVSGLAGVAGGYLNAMMNDTSSQSEADKLQTIADQLSSLIDQARSDALYYQTTLKSKSADYANSTVSVNDAIIAPGGKVITTDPDDYLIATKTPGSLGNSGDTKVYFTVVNNVGSDVEVSKEEKTNSDGTKEIVAIVRKITRNDIASGELDGALDARDRRLQGRRLSN